ncbi:xylulokinase [Alicyclobacillus herbarius]|uniref:xylulokinase n=1 Tax=Alicyclobacillus herbarius TaxID=122960 RepID=UPI00040E6987|nr:xylulokinase [Alicyclobacillus herbarius]
MTEKAPSVLLGIDVGTSGVKVVAVSAYGRLLAAAGATYELYAPKSGYAEQHPEDWWQATVTAVHDLMDKLRAKDGDPDIVAIGLSGQMHGLVPLDQDGKPVRPAIIWCDLRTVAEAEWIEREMGRDTVIRLTENPPLANFTATRLLWMRQHEPEAYARIASFLLPKDYVGFRMTGVRATDVCDASGTLLFNVAARNWSEEMCKALDIPMAWLPQVFESGSVAGRVTPEAAGVLGIPPGVPVVAGAGDQGAGAIGLGIVDPGTVSVVLGTSGVVLSPSNHPIRDPLGRVHTFCHAVPGQWFTMGVTQAAGGSLQWYRRQLAQVEDAAASLSGQDVYDLLTREAAQAEAGAGGVLFLPYLLGERTPHLDADARGSWIGLDWRHGRPEMVRAVLEGVAFSLRDCWACLAASGMAADTWRVSGGGAKGRLWVEILASVLGRPIQIVHGIEGPAYGAAILAALGAGVIGLEDIAAWIEVADTVAPNLTWQSRYDRQYRLYQEAYQALKPVFSSLRALDA